MVSATNEWQNLQAKNKEIEFGCKFSNHINLQVDSCKNVMKRHDVKTSENVRNNCNKPTLYTGTPVIPIS